MKLKKGLGQHLLVSGGVLEKIAIEADPEGKEVVEIGGGTGNLTREILRRNPQSLTVLEIDREMVNALENIGDPRLRVLEADAKEFDLCTLGKDLVLCGNLPYKVWAGIVERVVLCHRCIESGVFMLQKETALKLAGKAKPGWIGIFFRTYFEVRYVMSVPARFFVPKPKVSSGVIKFINKHAEGIPQNLIRYKEFLLTVFRSPRKMLRTKVPEEALRKAKIEGTKRVEELSLEEIIRLYNVYWGSR